MRCPSEYSSRDYTHSNFLLDLISAIFSGEKLLMTSFSRAGQPRLKISWSNTDKPWNLIMCHHTCTSGLTWYSGTNRKDSPQLKHWMCFTTVLMKVWGNTLHISHLMRKEGADNRYQIFDIAVPRRYREIAIPAKNIEFFNTARDLSLCFVQHLIFINLILSKAWVTINWLL